MLVLASSSDWKASLANSLLRASFPALEQRVQREALLHFLDPSLEATGWAGEVETDLCRVEWFYGRSAKTQRLMIGGIREFVHGSHVGLP
ncbi:hypothetical protein SETIT_9G395500v2 [Setaria italica]|uniref:Uncharacterized protein n=2 Tax=Setaria TaxID=4554 RepID=A0A368SQL1_SETIT|nr:hypothetical protein SETIT_9G395500v2 [Setaria italica]TKV95968.1 hypothetical protein SEVIR_9G398100v2 [Setaria viridis]